MQSVTRPHAQFVNSRPEVRKTKLAGKFRLLSSAVKSKNRSKCGRRWRTENVIGEHKNRRSFYELHSPEKFSFRPAVIKTVSVYWIYVARVSADVSTLLSTLSNPYGIVSRHRRNENDGDDVQSEIIPQFLFIIATVTTWIHVEQVFHLLLWFEPRSHDDDCNLTDHFHFHCVLFPFNPPIQRNFFPFRID